MHTVYAWLNDPDNSTPVTALTAAGETEVALAVRGTARLPTDQRGGVYGTSRKMCRFLTNRHILSWVCPTGPEDTRPQSGHPARHQRQWHRGCRRARRHGCTVRRVPG